MAPRDTIDPGSLACESPPVPNGPQSPEDSPTISLVGHGESPPTVNFNLREMWSTYWPLPVAGVSYLIHLRYRRQRPRRLPTLTSMSLRELYGTGACLGVAALEVNRLAKNLAHDRDLLTIEFAAVRSASRSSCHASRIHLRKANIMVDTKSRDEMSDECARREQRPGRMRWFYDHMWSDIVSWNCAWLHVIPAWVRYNVEQVTSQGKVLPQGDLDICITHFANMARAMQGSKLFFSAAIPFATALCGVTPLAMVARRFGPRVLWLSLNGIQRSLVYATAWLAAAQHHQHYSYPATLQDKHGVAEMLLRADPGLDKVVNDVIRTVSEELVIVWPG